MRIVIALSAGLYGGVRRVIESWARILGGAGHDVIVVSSATPAAEPLPPMTGVRNEFVEDRSSSTHRLRRLYVMAEAALRKLEDIAARKRVDLVVSHESQLSLRIRRSFPEVPLLGTFHSPLVDENQLNNWKYEPSWQRRLAYPATWALLRRIDRQALEAVSCAHTLSDYTWTILSQRYPRACRSLRWEKIPGSYCHHRFAPPTDRTAVRRELGLDPGETILLTVRGLKPRNGVDRIPRCAKALRDQLDGVRFLIGGTGEMEATLEQQVRQEGLSDVIDMLGFIPEDRLPAYYQAADAFLLPTRDLECFGLPVIEAMACGCMPLVMPDGGPAEVLRDHPELIARQNSSEAFTELVSRFLSGVIAPREPGIERYAVESYAEHAIAPSVLRLVESLAVQL